MPCENIESYLCEAPFGRPCISAPCGLRIFHPHGVRFIEVDPRCVVFLSLFHHLLSSAPRCRIEARKKSLPAGMARRLARPSGDHSIFRLVVPARERISEVSKSGRSPDLRIQPSAEPSQPLRPVAYFGVGAAHSDGLVPDSHRLPFSPALHLMVCLSKQGRNPIFTELYRARMAKSSRYFASRKKQSSPGQHRLW